MIVDVLAANQAFYQAHEDRDFPAMQAVWEHSDRATCIHPGWQILRGWPMVEQSWQRILTGPGRNQFIITNESVMIDGGLAFVTLDENLVGAQHAGTIAATNVFALTASSTDPGTGTAWKMILHHGSPVAATIA